MLTRIDDLLGMYRQGRFAAPRLRRLASSHSFNACGLGRAIAAPSDWERRCEQNAAPYFQRLKNEVFSSPELAQLARYAVFVYADPSHDVAAKRIGKALGYDKWPIISLLAPNGSALDDEARIVGLWDAPTVTTQLSIHMRSNGWLPSPTTHSTPHPPWVPPRPTAPQ